MDYEPITQQLEATGQYKVLRKLQPRPASEPSGKIGIFLDTETTGIQNAEIIELAMIPFYYDTDIHGVGEPFNRLRQPSSPISAEITKLTGISNEMVKDLSFTDHEVEDFIQDAVIIVAHNAEFDRPVAEKFCQAFAKKAWACSMADIPWKEEGFDSLNLSYLTMAQGFYYEGHRALNDCQAAIELLSRPLPSGVIGLKRLLNNARVTSWRIWATGSPFDSKDILKNRGYRWSDGSSAPKAWWIDVKEKKTELEWLSREIYHQKIDLPVSRVTAFNRYSIRQYEQT